VLWQLFPQLKVRLKAQFVLGLWPCKTGSKAFERPSGFGAVYALPQAVKKAGALEARWCIPSWGDADW